MKTTEFKVLLGYTKKAQYGERRPIYLTGFSWDYGWYWGGGYIGNKDLHTHFDGCFLGCPDSRGHSLGSFYDPWTPAGKYTTEENIKRMKNGAAVWEDLEFFLDDVPEHIAKNWWRIKDLYKQFYAYKEAAECFRHGGHCTSEGRKPEELVPGMADAINKHIETVIIPAITEALGV